jgi:glycerol uptake facilitator-like aquaporin
MYRFMAFGLGLDPRQAQAFGTRIGPLLVGCALGLISFATSGLFDGYTGAGMNPARCLAFAVARGSFQSMSSKLKQKVQFLTVDL